MYVLNKNLIYILLLSWTVCLLLCNKVNYYTSILYIFAIVNHCTRWPCYLVVLYQEGYNPVTFWCLLAEKQNLSKERNRNLSQGTNPQEAILSLGRNFIWSSTWKKHFWNYYFRYTSTNSNWIEFIVFCICICILEFWNCKEVYAFTFHLDFWYLIFILIFDFDF